MANSSIEEEFERLRVRVENLKMSEKAKADFFQSEWNRLCEKEEKEKERQAMLEEKEKERQAMLEEKEKERQAMLEEKEKRTTSDVGREGERTRIRAQKNGV